MKTTSTLDKLIATAQDQAARYLAADLTYRTAEIQDALINRLEGISHGIGDRSSYPLVTAAVARLSPRTSEALYLHACRAGRYAAAKFITRTAGLGEELYRQACSAERELLAGYVLSFDRSGGAE